MSEDFKESGVASGFTPKNDMMGDVASFHRKFNMGWTGTARILPHDLFDYRHKFHLEEITEYSDEQPLLESMLVRPELHGDGIAHSLEIQLDSLVDAAWVIIGTAELQFGAARFNEAWRRVVVANMAKVLAISNPDAQDSGRAPKYDIRKPPGWTPPDHSDLVRNHMHRGCEDEGCPEYGTPHGHDPSSVVK